MAKLLARFFVSLVVCAGVAGAAHAQQVVLSILEGKAVVIRQTIKLEAVEGVPIKPDDIIETAPGSFIQVEFADGQKLGLGADTRVIVQPSSARRGGAPAAYLMQGWAKFSQSTDKARTPLIVWTQRHELAVTGGSVIVFSSGTAEAVFVEAGALKLSERAGGRTKAASSMGTDAFLSLRAGDKPVAATRPAPDFVAQMPRAFRDALPSRAAKFRDNPPTAKALGDVTYEDIGAWISAEASIRLPMVDRWRPRLRDKAFRAALSAHLPAHPEWDPILFPEKYAPKKADADRSKSSKPSTD